MESGNEKSNICAEKIEKVSKEPHWIVLFIYFSGVLLFLRLQNFYCFGVETIDLKNVLASLWG